MQFRMIWVDDCHGVSCIGNPELPALSEVEVAKEICFISNGK